MFLPWMALNGRHPGTDICDNGGERKLNRLVTEDSRAGTETGFQDYGLFLAILVPLKYLGRLLMSTDYNWLAVVSSRQKSQKKWDQMPWILGHDCRDARNPITFFKAFFRAIILFGSEMGVLTPSLVGLWGDSTTVLREVNREKHTAMGTPQSLPYATTLFVIHSYTIIYGFTDHITLYRWFIDGVIILITPVPGVG